MKIRDKRTYISVAALAVLAVVAGFNMPTHATHQSIAIDAQSAPETTVNPTTTADEVAPPTHQDVIPTGTEGVTPPAQQSTSSAPPATPITQATLVSSSKCMVEKQDARGDTISVADYDYQTDSYSDGSHTVTQYSTVYQNIPACPGNTVPN